MVVTILSTFLYNSLSGTDKHIISIHPYHSMPGIGMMKRRLEKESDAVALAISAAAKTYDITPAKIQSLETKFHTDSGDWYVALGWDDTQVVVQMDSVQATIIEIKEI